MYPRNLQQDSLNGPLNLGIYSNSSSNLLRGPLVRSHSIFDGKYIDNIIIQYIYIYICIFVFVSPEDAENGGHHELSRSFCVTLKAFLHRRFMK